MLYSKLIPTDVIQADRVMLTGAGSISFCGVKVKRVVVCCACGFHSHFFGIKLLLKVGSRVFWMFLGLALQNTSGIVLFDRSPNMCLLCFEGGDGHFKLQQILNCSTNFVILYIAWAT